MHYLHQAKNQLHSSIYYCNIACRYGNKKDFMSNFIWFCFCFSNTFEIIDRTVASLKFFSFSGFFKTGVTFSFFRLLGNSSVFNAWLNSCFNVLAAAIVLVFVTLGGIYISKSSNQIQQMYWDYQRIFSFFFIKLAAVIFLLVGF